ncbi:ankyrin-1-like [Mizuhopecten yessoensis]|uniref:ankyrin-1-like n=1 Tax=Mizuhopecten yessoensis TaxID=6573 RepID=UPI000B45A338|nr:ankyrin-1-like [Mizuhopecten yessoensis]
MECTGGDEDDVTSDDEYSDDGFPGYTNNNGYGTSKMNAIPNLLSEHVMNENEQQMGNPCCMTHSFVKAASEGDLETVTSHIESGIDINSVNEMGDSALCMSCYYGQIQMTKYLLKLNASVNYSKSDFEMTPLHACAKNGYIETVDILLQHGDIDVDKRDASNNTALHLACQQEHLAIVQRLLRHGADVNARDCLDRTPLFAAVKGRSNEIVDQLIQFNGDTNLNDVMGKSIMHYASVYIIQQLGKGLINRKDNRGQTPLMTAVILGQPKKVDLLLAMGADPDTPDITGVYPIQKTMMKGFDATSVQIGSSLRSQSSINQSDFRDPSTQQMFRDASAMESISGCVDYFGYIPLCLVCKALTMKGTKALEDVIDFNFNNKFPRNSYVAPQINASIWNSDLPGIDLKVVSSLESLMEAGCDYYREDKRKNRPLFYCVKKQKKLQLFMSKGPLHYNVMDQKMLVLHHCAKMNDAESAIILLKGFNTQVRNVIDSVDRNGATALHIAAAHGSVSVLMRLLEFGSSANKQDKHGNTPLHFAAFIHMPDLYRFLVREGASLQTKDKAGETALDIAAKCRCYPLLEDRERIVIEERFQNRFMAARHGFSFGEVVYIPRRHMNSIHITDQELHCLLNEKTVGEKGEKKTSGSYVRMIKDTFGLGSVEYQGEALDVKKAILLYIHKVALEIAKADTRFRNTVVFTGSSADNTKVGFPNEFDVMIVLDRFSEICCELSSDKRENTLFVPLKIRRDAHTVDFFEFINDGYLARRKVFDAFGELLWSVLSHMQAPSQMFPSLWKRAMVAGPSRNPVTCPISLIWRGLQYKQMEIDIDFVPAIHCKTWPSFVQTSTTVDDEIKRCGIHLVAKPLRTEVVMETTNSDNLWRMSFSMAERMLINRLPEEVKDVYRVCKALRNSEVCPQIVFTPLNPPPPLFSFNIMENIPSYFLKVGIFNMIHAHRTTKSQNVPVDDRVFATSRPCEEAHDSTYVGGETDVHEMDDNKLDAVALYSYMADAFQSENLPYFFSPDYNLLRERYLKHKAAAVDICRMLSEIASL